MRYIRKKALFASINEFFIFSFVGFSLMLILFHAGILALPVIAFMWTFLGFNLFTFVVGIEIKRRYKVSFAVLNFLVVSLLIVFLINSSGSVKNETLQIVASASSVVVGILYLLEIILFAKNYFKPVKTEILRLLKIIPQEPSLEDCKTKYPILLVHGTGFRDRKIFNYWGFIPDLLKEHGADVFYSRHDAWANIEDAANQILASLNKIFTETGADKVNVIAHSKGGIDVRYAISKLGISEKVASITMISSPNNGSKIVDILCSSFCKHLIKFCSFFVNIWFRILGDKKPNFYETTLQFRASFMKDFNKEIIDSPSIIYQSFAGKMKNPFSDFSMFLLNFVINLFEGENDGLVSVKSAQWGNFRGVIESQGFFGISHVHEVDGYRSNPKIKENENLPIGSKTIRDFYIGLVRELKEKGL